MRTRGFFVMVVLGACGGSGGGGYSGGPTGNMGFAGTWSGLIMTTGAKCSDGSSVPAASNDITTQITTSGNEALWQTKCGELRLTINGNTAIQKEPRTCAPITENGVQTTLTLRTSTLILDGNNALKITYTADAAVAGQGKTATCTLSYSGTLVRN